MKYKKYHLGFSNKIIDTMIDMENTYGGKYYGKKGTREVDVRHICEETTGRIIAYVKERTLAELIIKLLNEEYLKNEI